MPSVVPLPLMSQLESVDVGVNTPVMPIMELAPTRALPSTTPLVSSARLVTGNSQNHLT